MSKIKDVKAREILDSRGNPTVEATVILNDGFSGTASCPSGASVSSYEAVELRDNDQNKFHGMGVSKAVENIKSIIAPALIGTEISKQQEIDKKMLEIDGTPNKSKLGANAILSVSMACCKAAAEASVLPLFLYIRQFIRHENIPPKVPTPLFNLINGGKHAGGTMLNFQEFLIIPASSKPYKDSLQIGVNIYKNLRDILEQNNLSLLVGDEGGYSPKIATNYEALSYLKQAITPTNLRIGFDVFFGLDAAANTFSNDKKYKINDKESSLSAKEIISYYEEINNSFRLLYLEDPLNQDDVDGWSEITGRMSQNTIIVGDDLTATNPFRLQTALDKQSITGIVIKPNQIGTVLETLAVVEMARAAGLKITVSHRSGETNDTFIADFAVGISADYAKFGAPARGERVAKYNRLLQIEEQLKELKIY